MQAHIVAADGIRVVETDCRWTAGGPVIPCHRCGLCCERWQPLLTRDDAVRLAAHRGLSLAGFHAAFTDPYPFDDEQCLLRRADGRCVFLRYDGMRAACAVHAARPQVCRDWAAGLDKKECMQGLKHFAGQDGLIQIEDLYPEREDRAALLRVCGPDAS